MSREQKEIKKETWKARVSDFKLEVEKKMGPEEWNIPSKDKTEIRTNLLVVDDLIKFVPLTGMHSGVSDTDVTLYLNRGKFVYAVRVFLNVFEKVDFSLKIYK